MSTLNIKQDTLSITCPVK